MKNSKKVFSFILCFSIVFTVLSGVCTVSAATVNNITVTINGRNIEFDVPPQLINDRTMVPLRAIFEALEATVDWDNETKTVTSKRDDTTISLTINNPTMYVNGKAIMLDSPACLINDRTLVPVRAISEAFKARVYWNNEAHTVAILTDTPSNESVSEEVKAENEEEKQEEIVKQDDHREKEDENEWYSSSMYRVGTDIPAGDYYAVTEKSDRSGYYCKYADSTQEDIEDNDNFNNFTFFRCYNGQYLKLSRCKITPIKNAPVYSSDDGTYGEGMYRVGIDIPAGEYKFTVIDSNRRGYYCAYTDITYDDIVDNDIFDDVAYYTVKKGQYLKINRCTAVCIDKSGKNFVKDEYDSDKEDKGDSHEDYDYDYKEIDDSLPAYERLLAYLKEKTPKTSKTYGVVDVKGNVNLSIISSKDEDYITFMAFNSSTTVTLFVYKDKEPAVMATVEDDDGNKAYFMGKYSSPEVEIFKSDLPSGNDRIIEVFNQTYVTFDMMMKAKGINMKVSDFGIDY